MTPECDFSPADSAPRPAGPALKPRRDLTELAPLDDPTDLCALNSAILRRVAASQGFALTDQEVSLFERYAALLVVWNRVVNLSRLVRPDEIALQHILDSLMCFRGLGELDGAPAIDEAGHSLRVADIGSGAGMPGLALAITRPRWQVTLIESVGKKGHFLTEAARALGLKNVEVIAERSEAVGRSAHGRDGFDIVTARAVADLPILVEYALPLVKVGGRLIAMKGGDAGVELERSRSAIQVLGGRALGLVPYHLPSLEVRNLVVVEKRAKTPSTYPRTTAAIKARPLGVGELSRG